MKNLNQYITEHTDIDKFIDGENFDYYVVNIPEIVEYIKTKFPGSLKGIDTNWAQFNSDKISIDEMYIDEDIDVMLKNNEKKQFYEFMLNLVPRIEDIDDVDVKEMNKIWDNASQPFRDLVFSELDDMVNKR